MFHFVFRKDYDMFASYETIPHNQATGELIDKIVAIKEGPWPHGKASQVAWIERNLRPDDEHCILRVQGEGRLGLCNTISIGGAYSAFASG